MSLDFRTHRLWDSYSSLHLRVALIVGALLIAPVLTGARPWETRCELAAERVPTIRSPGVPPAADPDASVPASPVTLPAAGE